MTRLNQIILSVLLALTAFFASAPAFAQATAVVAIDDTRIFRDSKAGKDIINKLKNIENQIRGEIEPTAKSLESEGKSIEAKLKGKTREQVAADTALVSQIQALEKKATDFGQKRATVNQEYALTEQRALVDFNKALEPVMMEVIKEKNAQLVVNKNAVVFSADNIDVSALVIQKLDQKTPSISVSRQRVPAAKAATTTKPK